MKVQRRAETQKRNDTARQLEVTMLKTLKTQVSELQAANKTLQSHHVPAIPDDASDSIFTKHLG
jgi:hypothetical protein